MDVGDEMCWWQLLDVCDDGPGFGNFGQQHLLSFYTSVTKNDGNFDTNIKKLSLTSSHQHHDDTNITVTNFKKRIQKWLS